MESCSVSSGDAQLKVHALLHACLAIMVEHQELPYIARGTNIAGSVNSSLNPEKP